MSKRIITISREFGSGGRTIGKEVAQKLGYSYYDKELVRQVAVETGFDEKYIEQAGEYAPSKNWLSFGFAARGSQGAMEGMSANDFLWAIQCRVIRSLAEKEPCVIGKTPGGEGQEAPRLLQALYRRGLGHVSELPPLSGQRNHRHPAVRGHHLRAGKDTVKNCGGS